MADEETESPAKKSSMIPILGSAAAALVIGLGAGFVMFSPGEETQAPAEGSTEAGAAADSLANYQERLIQLEPLVVNIEGDGYTRLLKMTIALECESVPVREEAVERMPQMRDSALTLVASRRLVDLIGFEGKVLLKEDLRARFNTLLTAGRINEILLTEFVVQ